jgi:hypothetical protein
MTRKLLLFVLMTVFLVPSGVVLAQETPESTPEVKSVIVDIKPGSCNNPVNFKSRGVLPVAILLEEEIALEDIIGIEVTFALPDPAVAPEPEDEVTPQETPVPDFSPVPVKTVLSDISSPTKTCEEKALDGVKDISLKYKTQPLVQAMSKAGIILENGDQQEITLHFTVSLEGGTTLEGSDTILAKRPGKAKGKGKNKVKN